MANGYTDKYRPAGVASSKWTVKFIAYTVERSWIKFVKQDQPGQGGSMTTYFNLREDADAWADKNGKRFVYKYGKDLWIVSVPWRRMLLLLALSMEDLCPVHQKLAGHLIAVGDVNREMLKRNRNRFSHAAIRDWNHGEKRVEKMKKYRVEQWHGAVMARGRIKTECPQAIAYRKQHAIDVPKERAEPAPRLKLVPLDLTVGEVLR